MAFSSEWRALQREAQLSSYQIGSGVTALGKANHAQPGLYTQAFFGLSIGIERIGKLIFIADYAIQNAGAFPSDSDLRGFGHELKLLLPKCEQIGLAHYPGRNWATIPNDEIHCGIINTLSEFGTKTRYYNLNYLSGNSSHQIDPIQKWWEDVGVPILKRHYTAKQRKRDEAAALLMEERIGENAVVIHQSEDGKSISDVQTYFQHGPVTGVVQKFGRLYTLQVIRWLVSLLGALSHDGAYKHCIEPLLGLNEHFTIFYNDDSYFRTRKTWTL